MVLGASCLQHGVWSCLTRVHVGRCSCNSESRSVPSAMRTRCWKPCLTHTASVSRSLFGLRAPRQSTFPAVAVSHKRAMSRYWWRCLAKPARWTSCVLLCRCDRAAYHLGSSNTHPGCALAGASHKACPRWPAPAREVGATTQCHQCARRRPRCYARRHGRPGRSVGCGHV